MRILLVDDDRVLIDVLSKSLAEQNYVVDAVTDGEQGWIYGSTYAYDLIILDWCLPELDGINLCQRFRANGYEMPILLLTARHGSQDKIKGLDAGADDYLCKPFDVEELAARIRALLRRLNSHSLPILTWQDLQLDPSTGRVTYQGKLLSLTSKEYGLLELLLRHDREVLSIEEIIENLWSSAEYPAEATVRSHVRRLRQKLKQAGLPEDSIETLPGRGYCFKSLSQEQISQETSEENKRSQHLAALSAAWQKYQHKSNEQLLILESAVRALRKSSLSNSDRADAIFAAHKLAGNLGLFGFDRASELAREVEQLLQSEVSPTQLANILLALRQELATDKQVFNRLQEDSPLVLIVDDDSKFTESLTQEATNRAIRTMVAPTPESARTFLEERSKAEFPNAVVLKLSVRDSSSNPISRWERLSLIAECYLLEPPIPVIVIADRDRLQDRLQAVRHGSCFYLKQPITPSQTISFCQQVLQRSARGKKVMVVDDDVDLLKFLPSLLQPWGFSLTTLADPRQFWDVLQAVDPHLLVLDIEMPYLSGIELCKVLRTHPHWCNLPVLFLSVHTDVATREQALASGADDFVNKPFAGKQLAHRICHFTNKTEIRL